MLSVWENAEVTRSKASKIGVLELDVKTSLALSARKHLLSNGSDALPTVLCRLLARLHFHTFGLAMLV